MSEQQDKLKEYWKLFKEKQKMEEQKPRKIFAYKFFKSTEEFEDWQKDEFRELLQIQPMVNDLSVSVDGNKSTSDITSGVLVTYVKEIF